LGDDILALSTKECICAGYSALETINKCETEIMGTVHGCFRRALNISTSCGRLIALTTDDVPVAPNSMVTTLEASTGWLALGIRAGDVVNLAGDPENITIHFPSRAVSVVASPRSIYYPRIQSAEPIVISESAIFPMLHLALESAVEHGIDEGFYPLLAFAGQLLADSGIQVHSPPHALNCLCSQAYSAMCRLLTAIRLNDTKAISLSAKGLIGLGPGLTPSGDDAITGLLVSLALTLKAYGRDALVTHPSKGIGSLVLSIADYGTNTISQELLWYAARGEASSPIEAVILDILSGSTNSVRESTRKLISQGASSGVDQLWGILLGIPLAFDVC
jgi:hypothetical protein